VFAVVWGPVGPGWGTANSPGQEGTAKRIPSSSFIPTSQATLENDRIGLKKCRPSSSLNLQDAGH